VLTKLAANEVDQQTAKDISQLEHELVEASSSLNSTLEAMSSFESRMAKVDAELELSNMRCAQLEEREKNRVVELENWLLRWRDGWGVRWRS